MCVCVCVRVVREHVGDADGVIAQVVRFSRHLQLHMMHRLTSISVNPRHTTSRTLTKVRCANGHAMSAVLASLPQA